MNNKKGEERVLSFFWLLILIIVGIFVSIGVIMFYSSEQDVRKIEAEILATRVIDCLLENGQLSLELVDNENIKDNFIEKCNLNEQVIIDNNLYVGVSFYNLNNGELKGRVELGDVSYVVLCGVEAKKDLECTEENAFVLNGDEKLKIHVLTASNHKGRII